MVARDAPIVPLRLQGRGVANVLKPSSREATIEGLVPLIDILSGQAPNHTLMPHAARPCAPGSPYGSAICPSLHRAITLIAFYFVLLRLLFTFAALTYTISCRNACLLRKGAMCTGIKLWCSLLSSLQRPFASAASGEVVQWI